MYRIKISPHEGVHNKVFIPQIKRWWGWSHIYPTGEEVYSEPHYFIRITAAKRAIIKHANSQRDRHIYITDPYKL